MHCYCKHDRQNDFPAYEPEPSNQGFLSYPSNLGVIVCCGATEGALPMLLTRVCTAPISPRSRSEVFSWDTGMHLMSEYSNCKGAYARGSVISSTKMTRTIKLAPQSSETVIHSTALKAPDHLWLSDSRDEIEPKVWTCLFKLLDYRRRVLEKWISD